MTNQNTALFGIFRSRSETVAAIDLLKKDGFSSADISVLFPENQGAQDFPQVQKNQLRNGAIVGAIVGVILVGTLGGAVAAGVFPSLYAGGSSVTATVMTVLISVVLGGVAGAACGTLVGIGTPDPAGKRYGQYIHAGGILLSVNCTSAKKLESARLILDRAGAEDINDIDETDGWQEAVTEEHQLIHLDTEDFQHGNNTPAVIENNSYL
jgi:hypothetical protein